MSHLINLLFHPRPQLESGLITPPGEWRRSLARGPWDASLGLLYLLSVLFAIPAAVPGDSFPPSPIQSNWPAETAVSTRFKKCFLWKLLVPETLWDHISSCFHCTAFPGTSRRSTVSESYRRTAALWFGELKSRRLEAGLLLRHPASSESGDPANVNTSEEVFSIKVSNIWLHKHNTGCKNKVKKLMLISSIKIV